MKATEPILDSSFVFTNIPAFDSYLFCFHRHSRFSAAFPQRSFVFIDFPALLVRFSTLLVLSSPVGGDILSRAAMPAKSRLRLASLKRSRHSAVSSRQWAVTKSEKATHNP